MSEFKDDGLYIQGLDDEWIEIGDITKRLQILEDKMKWLWDKKNENNII